jgi:hypothetical protein
MFEYRSSFAQRLQTGMALCERADHCAVAARP